MTDAEMIRVFTIFQTMEGWYWTQPGFSRPIGPYETLAQTCADLQDVMAPEGEPS